jgi:putative transposase
MFVTGAKMRAGRNQQPLSYDVRLPDEAQADSLRLLDASREVVNAALVLLWPHLDEFMKERRGQAWKQVVELIDSPDPHGDRQWRCEAETAGRIMRAQAERKRVFQTIQPILTDSFIRPKEANRPAVKNRKNIKEAITELQKSREDDDTGFVTMQNVIEQCCNYYFEYDCFPATYEELQPLPRLLVGLLTFAGDDGGAKGQAYRFSLDQQAGTATLLFRFPDEQGRWCWRKTPTVIKLPEIVKQRLKEGSQLAPALREHTHPDGSRIAVLDFVVSVSKASLPPFEQIEGVLGVDWGVRTLLTATACDSAGQQVGRPFFLDTGGFDGRQARTRRQIDELKAKVAKLEVRRDSFPEGDRRREPSIRKLAVLRREIDRCWRKYELRNQALAHLAANVLLLLCTVHGCSLLCMESLKTLKSTGRGKGVRGRWRNYRNNSTIRGEIWRILRYKCHLTGIRFRSERPKDTSHTCPRCGQPAHTYRSPTERAEAVKWGRWLWCENPRCGWNGDRDYAAALNIARLGITFLTHLQRTNKAQAFKMTDPLVKPVSYTRTGAVLLLPPTGPRTRPTSSGKVYYPGWTRSAYLQSSSSKETFLRLCG